MQNYKGILSLLFFSVFVWKSIIAQSETKKSDVIRNKIKPCVIQKNLGKKLDETSGLIVWNGIFWTINDSGGEPEIYGFDKNSGNIKKVIRISNATNRDWEDIAQDEHFIYIGDFGNNSGARKEFIIWKIKKADISQNDSDNVAAQKIVFAMADKPDFGRKPYHHNYDCEAFFALNDSLFVFTKNWVDLKTRLYVFPANPGTYTVWPSDSIFANGWVTGVDINPLTREVLLIGYRYFKPFYIKLFLNADGLINKQSIQRKTFVASNYLQTEGIAWENGNVYVTSERLFLPACLLQLPENNFHCRKPLITLRCFITRLPANRLIGNYIIHNRELKYRSKKHKSHLLKTHS